MAPGGPQPSETSVSFGKMSTSRIAIISCNRNLNALKRLLMLLSCNLYHCTDTQRACNDESESLKKAMISSSWSSTKPGRSSVSNAINCRSTFSQNPTKFQKISAWVMMSLLVPAYQAMLWMLHTNWINWILPKDSKNQPEQYLLNIWDCLLSFTKLFRLVDFERLHI